MNRVTRASASTVLLLLSGACFGAPASAPVPRDGSPTELRAASVQDRCGGVRDAMSCYSGELLALLDAEGVVTAMTTLEALAERDAQVDREGHMYAHEIGLAAFSTPGAMDSIFRSCKPSFQSGCYHGVIQSYFAFLANAGRPIDAAATEAVCEAYRSSEADRWLRFQCVHGLGHGLAMIHADHLPGALSSCDVLHEEWDREGCYGGVFMESIVQATQPHHTVGRPQVGHSGEASKDGQHDAHAAASMHDGHVAATANGQTATANGGHSHGVSTAEVPAPFPPLKPDEPLYPCTVLDARYSMSCYQMQTSAILFFNDGDLAATAAACDDAPELYRTACYLSLGRDVSAITGQDGAAAMEACRVGDPRFQVWCDIGFVKNLVDLTADPGDALDYCRQTTSAAIKQACYHAVGEEIWVLTSDGEQAEQWCARAEAGQRETCRRGAGLVSWRDAAG